MAKRLPGKYSTFGKDAIAYEKTLINKESFVFVEEEDRPLVSDEELNSRYTKGEIRIVTESARYSLAGILAMLQEEVAPEDDPTGPKERRYKLDPEYQRRHRWDNQRKSRLIESFLMNVPVPPVFLYERDLARFEVMDGRQRLTALSEFYGNKFRLEGLEYWPDLDGKFYNELPSKVRDGIDRRYISSIILLKETATDEEQASLLKKIVFERLNSGGVKLSAQETRNAVYPGKLNDLCLKLSSNEKFCRMWGVPTQLEDVQNADDDLNEELDESNSRQSTVTGRKMFEKMEDVELVLRFFAYRHMYKSKTGLNKITHFLDAFLKQGNKFSPSIVADYEHMFVSTIEFLYECLGLEAFSIIVNRKHWRPTKIVYDTIMYVSNLPEIFPHWERIKSKKGALREALREMYVEDQVKGQFFAGRKTNSSDIQARNHGMRQAFRSVINNITPIEG